MSTLTHLFRFLRAARRLYCAEVNSLALVLVVSLILTAAFRSPYGFLPLIGALGFILFLDAPHPLVILDGARDLWRATDSS